MGSNGIWRNQYADLDEAVAEKLPRIRMSECGEIFVPIDAETKEVLPSVPKRLPPDLQPSLTRQIVRDISTCVSDFIKYPATNFEEARKKAEFSWKVFRGFFNAGLPKDMLSDAQAELEGEAGKTLAGTVSGLRQNWEQFREAEQTVEPKKEEESHDGNDD